MTSSVDQVYEQVRQMAANFEFKPAERINESELSKTLGASRTPLREAMNRLVAEGLLVFEPGKGFFCQPLTPALVVNLYELRETLELGAIRGAIARASDDDIAALGAFLTDTRSQYTGGGSVRDIVALDETFHMKIAELAQNPELLNMIRLVFQRIRYVRWIAMRDKAAFTPEAHMQIFDALQARDVSLAEDRMRDHIRTNVEQATETVQKAFSQLYVPQV